MLSGIEDSNVEDSGVWLEDLRCEGLPDPLGLDEPRPRLSWIVRAGGRGWRQSAYQILVASSAEALGAGHGDLWDSGKVFSARTSQIEYEGRPPVARQQLFWKARVWDDADAPSAWSTSGLWEMGLLSEADWKGAAWIGRAVVPEPTAPDEREPGVRPAPGLAPAPHLRREFPVRGPVRRARLSACGLGYADLFLNGQRIGGERERDPGYTAFDRRVLYVTHDVTALLSPGTNALGAILGSGWYDVADLATWNFDTASWRGSRRLRLVLDVEYDDGSSEAVLSDASWKTAPGPILRDGIYTGEIYDARRELPDWDRAGHEDHAWDAAALLPPPGGRLKALCCPPVAVTRTLAAVAVAEPEPGVYVADFGQNFTGHVRLRVQAPAGTRITLRYGEALGADGTLNTAAIDHFMTRTTPTQPFQSDTYVCKGGGEEIWEQRFSYSGFRYVQVTGLPERPSSETLAGRFAHTALESAGEFECSDEMLNRIHQATRWAYLSNAQNIPTDCPQREKNGWTADAHLAAEAGLINFRAATFYAKWLDDFADNQRPDGRLGMIVPTGGWGMGECHPAWDSAYALIAWDLYRYVGDTRVLERHFDPIRRYVDYLAGRTENGVVPFGSLDDWLPWETKTPSQLSSTVYLFRDAQILAQAARILGREDAAEKYGALAARTRDAFNAAWLDRDRGTYANAGQTAQAMPLFYGLVPEEHRAAAFHALVADLERQGHIDTGILGAKYVVRVLAQGGRSDLAYQIITRPEQPSWAWWIMQGATTLWEDWKGEGSLNHIMFGDVSNWLFQWIAGIGLDPDAPGFAHVRIQPQPVGGLTWARAHHDGPQGRIVSDWAQDEDAFRLNVVIPPSTTATICVPAHTPEQVREGGQPAGRASGVRCLRHAQGRAAYTVGSGTYTFTVTK